MSIFDNENFKPFHKNKYEIYIGKEFVCLSVKTIERLNFPQYVQLFINNNDKLFGIKSCKKNSKNSIRLSKNKKVGFYNKNIVSELRTLTCIDQNFKVEGNYIEEENALLFDLKKAYIVKGN